MVRSQLAISGIQTRTGQSQMDSRRNDGDYNNANDGGGDVFADHDHHLMMQVTFSMSG